MRKVLAVFSIGGMVTLAAPNVAHAGPFTDDMARCLVRATSESERVDLVRWIIAAVTVHPGVRGMVGIQEDRRNAETKQAADLFEELIVVRCRSESRDAINFEGESAFEAAFNVLGQVAMQTLMSDPAVNRQMTRLGEVMNTTELEKLLQGR